MENVVILLMLWSFIVSDVLIMYVEKDMVYMLVYLIIIGG